MNSVARWEIGSDYAEGKTHRVSWNRTSRDDFYALILKSNVFCQSNKWV